MIAAILTTEHVAGVAILAAMIGPQLAILAALHRRGMLPDQREGDDRG